MYRLISLRHNERSRIGEVNEEERGPPPLRRQRLSKKRFALLIGLFLLALFPNSGPPAVASPRVTGEITAHEVTIPLPAMNATLTRQGGGTVSAADAGQTGGETLLFSSPTISAGLPLRPARGAPGRPRGGRGRLLPRPRTAGGRG